MIRSQQGRGVRRIVRVAGLCTAATAGFGAADADASQVGLEGRSSSRARTPARPPTVSR
jgi:hypothetical protein